MRDTDCKSGNGNGRSGGDGNGSGTQLKLPFEVGKRVFFVTLIDGDWCIREAVFTPSMLQEEGKFHASWEAAYAVLKHFEAEDERNGIIRSRSRSAADGE